MTRRVGGLQRQYHHEGRVIRAGKPVKDQARGPVSGISEAEAEGPRDVRQEEDEDEQAAPVDEAVVGVDAREDAGGDYGPVRDLHQGGDQGAEAEALDDEGAEVRDAAVRDVPDQAEAEEQVELGVEERLADLVRLEVLVLDAGLVLPQPLDGHAPLRERELLGPHGRVREEGEDDDPPHAAERPDDQELVLPRRQGALDAADCCEKKPGLVSCPNPPSSGLSGGIGIEP